MRIFNMLNRKNIPFIIIGAVIVLLILSYFVWFLFFRTTSSVVPISFGTFGAGNNTSPSSVIGLSPGSTQVLNESGSTIEKIFEISVGPVTGAAFIQTSNPTTTLARFMTQQDGHVFDLPLDVPGAVLRPVSDTTIPGSQRVFWTQGGHAAILQYLDNNNTIKTVFVEFQSAASSTASEGAARVAFLPDSIIDLALSPDGSRVAYLLQSGQAIDGYTALPDGTGARLLFSIPLTQLLLSWPSPNTLLLQTPSSADTAGIVFAVGVKTGNLLPLVYGSGITAIANTDFSEIVYQTRLNGANNTYVHLLSSGSDVPLSIPVIPEKCVWASVATTTLYCANPTSVVASTYLDLWHQGTETATDNILDFDIAHGTAYAAATPGSADGGAQADIAEIMISPDDHYLMYITKGDRSLWGVRLTQ